MYQPRLAHMPEHVHDKKEKEKKTHQKIQKTVKTAQAKKLRCRSETRTSTKQRSLLNLQTDYLW